MWGEEDEVDLGMEEVDVDAYECDEGFGVRRSSR